MYARAHHRRRRGFTLTELLVTIGIIAALLAILLPALASVWGATLQTKSMANMRQVATWMKLYESDNRETIVPSQFDYSNHPYPGKVRSEFTIGEQHRGTWADILWTVYEGGRFPDAVADLGHDYRFDAPDTELYELMGGDLDGNPCRSAAENTENFQLESDGPGGASDILPRPFGPGAQDRGRPGYFAANSFFNADPTAFDGARLWQTGQIKSPERSVYLVDSLAGEVIATTDGAWMRSNEAEEEDVDFRYPGDTLLLLFLDGHIDTQGLWPETGNWAVGEGLAELEKQRQFKVRNLHLN